MHGRWIFLSCALTALLGACDPYNHVGENNESLGPVDPVNFPPGNLGQMGNRLMPGLGTFAEIPAYAGGNTVAYFAYPAPVKAGVDALRVIDDGKPYAGVPTPPAYAFDPTIACRKPAGYKYNATRDEVHYDQMGNVFSALPTATYTPGVVASSSYVPVVREVALSAKGRDCQSLKSEDQVKAVYPKAAPANPPNFLAWLIIDPGATVLGIDALPDDPGISLQHWGWFNGYLLAYLDGGVVPTTDVQVAGPNMTMKTVTRMVPQKLYYPRFVLGLDSMNMPGMAPGAPGQGYDVMEARLDEAGYSPLCELWTYQTPTPMQAAELPRSVDEIMAMYGATVMPATTKYLYCLQTRVVEP